MTVGPSVGSQMPNVAGIVFKYTDPDNYYLLVALPSFGGWAVDSIVGGTLTVIYAFTSTSFGPGTTVQGKLW